MWGTTSNLLAHINVSLKIMAKAEEDNVMGWGFGVF